MNGTNRGLSANPSNADYTDEEREFLRACSDYKSRRQRPFLSLTEIFEIARSLGYRKVAPPGEPPPCSPPSSAS